MKLIDGKKIANNIRSNLKEDIKKYNLHPGLAIILIGNNEASEIYVRNKIIACEEVGIKGKVFKFSENSNENEIIECLKKCNNDRTIHGIIIQSPVPKFNEEYLNSFISKEKDVDGFGIYNLGALASNQDAMIAATPAGIIKMLEYEQITLSGKHVVIIGRSKIVGRPLCLAMLNKDATVTVAHSKTENLKQMTKEADILVVAIGKPKFITKEYLKKDAIVIDVGINKLDNHTVGDVDFASVKDLVSYISPVPGGVGPMTIAMLLSNVVESSKKLEMEK